jgi:DNA/RNA-binding domain of Phe-tRNA-synthetase-like protein
MSPIFGYDQAALEQYPAIHGGVIHATGLENGPSAPELLEAYRAEQSAAAERLARTPIAELPSIAAWRRAFTRFGAKPTQHRSAAEALLRRLSKTGEIPSVNRLVDLGNLISIRHSLPVAVFDLVGVHGSLTVRLATGDEPFTEIGSTEVVTPEPGEVVFVDDRGVVAARRWCWRQSAQSATSPWTAEALIVTEGLHQTAGDDVAAALADLTSQLADRHPATTVRSWHLSSSAPLAG